MPATQAPLPPALLRRAEAWLWLGPAGHLAGGALDIAEALARHLLLPRLRVPAGLRGIGGIAGSAPTRRRGRR